MDSVEALATEVTSTPVTKVAVKSGAKSRPGVSFDTGIHPGKDSRYQAIKGEISAGRLKPSTHQLRKQWQCNYQTAAAYLSAMQAEGLLTRNQVNGQYARVKGGEVKNAS